MRLRFILIAILLLAFGLRLHKLADAPLRGDEAFSALYWSGLPLHESLREIASIEPHPPLTYALFRFWGVFIGGIDSVFSLRMLPVLGNLLGVAAMYGLARRLSGMAWLGVLAALLWALHPYEIWHSQDFRNYGVWAGLSGVALWLGLRLLQGRRMRDWLLYAVTASAAALLFYTEAFVMLGFGLFAMWNARQDRRFVARLLSLHGVILALVLLLFLILQGDLLSAGGYGGNLESLDLSHIWTRFLPTLLLGETNALPTWIWLPLLLVCAALCLALRVSPRQLSFLFAIGLLPTLLLGLVSLRVAVFDPRYALASAPAFVLLLVLGGAALARNRMRTTLLLLPWLALAGLSLQVYFSDSLPQKAPAWDELGGFLNRWADADDIVIQLSADAAFGYYYRGAAPDVALPESPRQSIEAIESALETLSAEHESIWVVANANPDWQNAAVVNDWMDASKQLVLQSDASGLGIRRYMDRQIDTPEHPPMARFGDAADLLDYRFFPERLPTGELLLWLDWRLLDPDLSSLKVFAHIYDKAGALLTQRDQPLTASSGELFREVYYLPAESLPRGEYELRVGLYDASTGERLLAAGADNLRLERLLIAD